MKKEISRILRKNRKEISMSDNDRTENTENDEKDEGNKLPYVIIFGSKTRESKDDYPRNQEKRWRRNER